MWILSETRCKKLQSLIQNHMRQERSESAREQRIILYKSDQLTAFADIRLLCPFLVVVVVVVVAVVGGDLIFVFRVSFHLILIQ